MQRSTLGSCVCSLGGSPRAPGGPACGAAARRKQTPRPPRPPSGARLLCEDLHAALPGVPGCCAEGRAPPAWPRRSFPGGRTPPPVLARAPWDADLRQRPTTDAFLGGQAAGGRRKPYCTGRHLRRTGERQRRSRGRCIQVATCAGRRRQEMMLQHGPWVWGRRIYLASSHLFLLPIA